MGNSDEVYVNHNDSLFNSGVIWLITSFFVTITPLTLTYIYKSIAEEKCIDITLFFKDILLILLSISCSLLALCIDKTKLLTKKDKQKGLIFSITLVIISGTYYSFIEGKSQTITNITDITDKYLCLGSIACILICAIKGYFIGLNHDRLMRKDVTITK